MSDILDQGLPALPSLPDEQPGIDYGAKARKNEDDLRALEGKRPLDETDIAIRDQQARGDLPYSTSESVFHDYIKASDNPGEALAKLNGASFYAKQLDIPIADAMRNYDSLSQAWWGMAKTPVSTWDSIKAAYVEGEKSFRLGNLYAKQRDQGATPELQAKITELEAEMPPSDKFQRSLPVQILKAAAGSIPYSAAAMVGNAAGAGVGTLAAAGLSALGFPEGSLAIGAVTFVARTVGGMAATTGSMGGLEYRDMVKQGVNPALAATASRWSGLLQSAVESEEIMDLLPTAAAKKSLVGAITKKISSGVLAGTFRNPLAQFALRAGARTLSEGAEEAVQQAISETVFAAVRDASNSEAGTNVAPHTWDAVSKGIIDNFVGGALASIPLGALGEPMSIAHDVKNYQADKAKLAALKTEGKGTASSLAPGSLEAAAGAQAGQGLASPRSPLIYKAYASDDEEGNSQAVQLLAKTDPSSKTATVAADFTVDNETGTVTISKLGVADKKLAKDDLVDANAQQGELLREIRRRYPGAAIEWTPTGSKGNFIKNQITAQDPAFFSKDYTSADTSADDAAGKEILSAFKFKAPEANSVAMAFIDNAAGAEGLTRAAWKNKYFMPEGFKAAPTITVGAGALAQDTEANGSTAFVNTKTGEMVDPLKVREFQGSVKAVITASQNADLHTFIHEIVHAMERLGLNEEQKASLEKHFGKKYSELTLEDIEDVAYGAEKHFRTGEAPAEGLRGLYDRIAAIMKSIVGSLRAQKVQLSPELSEFYDSLMGAKEAPLAKVDTKVEEAAPTATVPKVASGPKIDPIDYGPEPLGPTTTYEHTNDRPVVELPLSSIKAQDRLPNVKGDVNDAGINPDKAIQGEKYDRDPVRPIAVYEWKDGSQEVATGRHRVEYAKRIGEKTIPGQVYREADGFTLDDMAFIDAKSNIQDDQGSVKDYARVFKKLGISESEARKAGLLGRARGRQGFAIGTRASDGLYTLFANGKITEGRAAAIAEAAPNNDSVQAEACRKALANPSMKADELGNYARAIGAIKSRSGGGDGQIKIFGDDDPAFENGAKIAEKATEIQRHLAEQRADALVWLNTSKGDRESLGERLGGKAADKASAKKTLADIDAEIESWTDWETKPARFAELSRLAGLTTDDTESAAEAAPEAPPQDTETIDMFGSSPEPAPKAAPEIEKSKGHIAFYKSPSGRMREVFQDDAGDIFTADHTDVIDVRTKYRIGRWEGYARDKQTILDRFGISKSLFQDEDAPPSEAELALKDEASHFDTFADFVAAYADEADEADPAAHRAHLRAAWAAAHPKEAGALVGSSTATATFLEGLKADDYQGLKDFLQAKGALLYADKNKKVRIGIDPVDVQALRAYEGKELSPTALAATYSAIRANPFAYRKTQAKLSGDAALQAQVAAEEAGKAPASEGDIALPRVKFDPSRASRELRLFVDAVRDPILKAAYERGDVALSQAEQQLATLSAEMKDIKALKKSSEAALADWRAKYSYAEKKIAAASQELRSKELELKAAKVAAAYQKRRGLEDDGKYTKLKAEVDSDAAAIKAQIRALPPGAVLRGTDYRAALKATQEANASWRQKNREARAARAARNLMLSLGNSITAPVSRHTTDSRIADQIEAIQATIDPNFRRGIKGWAVSALRKIFHEGPGNLEGILPAAVIERLEKRPLNDWTIEELRDLKDRVDNLRELGRQVLAARKLALRTERQRQTGYMLGNLRDSGRFHAAAMVGSKEFAQDQKADRGFLHRWDLSLETMSRVARELDNGVEKGSFYTNLVEKERDAYRLEEAAFNRRWGAVEDKMKALGIDAKSLYAGEVKIGGWTLTRADAMGIYIGLMDEDTTAKIIYGNMLDADQRKEMTDEELEAAGRKNLDLALEASQQLTAPERELAAFFVDDADREFSRLSEATYQYENREPRKVQFYFPNEVRGRAGEENLLDTMREDLLNRSGRMTKGVGKGMTLNRIKIGARHQLPINLDAIGVYKRSFEKQEHYIGYAGFIREARSTFLNDRSASQLRYMVKQTHGQGVLDYIETWLAEAANPKAYNDFNRPTEGFDRVFKMLRGPLGVAYLGFRTSNAFKQLVTSPLPYLPYAKGFFVHRLFQNLSPAEFKRSLAFAKEKSAFIRNRIASLDFAMLKEYAEASTTSKAMKITATLSMKMMEWADIAAVSTGWNAVYEKTLAELTQGSGGKMSAADMETSAIKEADRITVETQPTGRHADISPVFKDQDQVKRFLTQFQSPMNVIYNQLFHDIPQDLRTGHIGRAVGVLSLYLAAGSILSLLAMPRKDDDDPDKILRTILGGAIRQPFDTIPMVGGVVGDGIESLITGDRRFRGSSSVFPGLDKLVGGATSMPAAKDEEAFIKAMMTFLEGSGMLVGVPTSALKEYYRTFFEGDFGALIGRPKK